MARIRSLCLVAVLLFSSCDATLSPRSATSTLVIAHRGGALEVPENTMAACRHAIDAGFEGVEIDVRVTADGHAVVIHDDTLKRTAPTADTRKITDLDLATIRGFDVGSFFGHRFRSERVPTLEEVLALDWSRTALMIEIKREGSYSASEWRPIDQRLVDAVVRAIEGQADRRGLQLASFSTPLLTRLHQRLPEMPLIGIVSEEKFIPAHLKLPIAVLAANRKLVSEALRQRVRDHGVDLWTWTVRKPDELRPLLDAGVDGVITDIPTEVARIIQD